MSRDERIVAAARRWLGTPYRHQASLLGVGCDCLGLVRGVWREIRGDEPEPTPPYSPDWAEDAVGDALLEAVGRHLVALGKRDPAPGLILAFRWRPHLPAKHLGIATAANRMVHAQDGAVVTEVALTGWWLRRLAGVFSIPEA